MVKECSQLRDTLKRCPSTSDNFTPIVDYPICYDYAVPQVWCYLPSSPWTCSQPWGKQLGQQGLQKHILPLLPQWKVMPEDWRPLCSWCLPSIAAAGAALSLLFFPTSSLQCVLFQLGQRRQIRQHKPLCHLEMVEIITLKGLLNAIFYTSDNNMGTGMLMSLAWIKWMKRLVFAEGPTERFVGYLPFG